MARFPLKEAEVVALAKAMIMGLTAIRLGGVFPPKAERCSCIMDG